MAFFSGSYATGSRETIIGLRIYGFDQSAQGGVYYYAGAYPQHFFTSSAPQPDAPFPTGSFITGTGGQFDLGRRVITKFSERFAHGPILNIPRVSYVDDWNVEFCFPKKSTQVDEGEEEGVLSALPHVSVANVDFSPRNVETTNFGSSLIGSLGTPFVYDGSKATELGFYVYPELRSAVSWSFGWVDGWRTMVPNPTGSIAPGIYGYSATYHWTDDQGNEYISAPSPTSFITTTGSCSIDVRVPCLTLTNKPNVSISIWRTINSGSTQLYRVTSGSAPLYNRPDLPYVIWRDDQRDELIENNIKLYTTFTGELPNIAPPISKLIKTHRNRAWLLDENDRSTLWFSKPRASKIGVEYAEDFTIEIPHEGGPITALESLGQLLIIFKSDRIYTLSGEGPDVANQNGSFSSVEELNGSVGCINKDSLVKTAQGVFFQSRQGIHVLENQGVRYIGASIEDTLQDLTITSAVAVEASNEVRFTTSQGKTLIYNYLWDRWSQSIGLSSADAVMYNNKHTILSSSGLVRQETSGSYSDDGQYYPMTIETPWIPVAGIQGYMMAKRATVLGNKKSDHELQITASFDYDDAKTQTKLFRPNNLVGGASSSVYQFAMDIGKHSRCQSIKFKFSDSAQSGSGESYSLEALDLRVSTRDKAYRLPAARYI